MNERHGTAPAFGLPWPPRGLMWKRSNMELTPREKDKLLLFTAAACAAESGEPLQLDRA